ncbi:hypothetical protein FGB62_1g023 [Gracilaria domingensis]|nr:hypothetical protein FGB62_1g023 [Gracilaria domingensis]
MTRRSVYAELAPLGKKKPDCYNVYHFVHKRGHIQKKKEGLSHRLKQSTLSFRNSSTPSASTPANPEEFAMLDLEAAPLHKRGRTPRSDRQLTLFELRNALQDMLQNEKDEEMSSFKFRREEWIPLVEHDPYQEQVHRIDSSESPALSLHIQALPERGNNGTFEEQAQHNKDLKENVPCSPDALRPRVSRECMFGRY